MKRLTEILTAAALAGFASGAMAADLPAYKARPMAAPAPSWTGFYIGAHAGWGWSDTNGTASSTALGVAGNSIFLPAAYDLGSDGAVFGGQIGYNWQAGNWVVGVEGDFSGAGISGFQSQAPQLNPFVAGPVPPGGTSFMRQDINWLASVRGRLGYAWGPSLLYVTGGAAWADVGYSADASPTGFAAGCCAFPASFGNTRSGWTIGGGFEHMITGNWSVRGEYLYYSFEGDTITAPIVSPLAPLTSRATYAFDDLDIHVFRFGLNYKLGADPAYSAMAMAAPVPQSWAGFYIGVHGGWGWSDTSATASSGPLTGALAAPSLFLPAAYDVGSDGAVFGGQIGYNWQAGNWVFGVEGDFSGTGMSGFQSQALQLNPVFPLVPPGGTSFMSQDINWIASVRGRLGYAWGPSLLYVTGGAAWADVDYRADANPTAFAPGCCAFPASFGKTRSGWTIGGGFEHMITGNWTVRGEYLYYSFDGETVTGPIVSSFVPAFTSNATYTFDKLDLHVLRAGLNYKF
jgi:outer membrane immunogenic protein